MGMHATKVCGLTSYKLPLVHAKMPIKTETISFLMAKFYINSTETVNSMVRAGDLKWFKVFHGLYYLNFS